MKQYVKAILSAGLLLALPFAARAATVTLTGIDALGTSSFNTAGLWDNASAPASGNDYVVPDATRLRTPPDGGSYTFEGDSLTINNTTPYGDGLMYKGTGAIGIVTVGNLIMDGGLLSHANGSADICNLDGGMTVAAGGARLYAKQGPINIYSDVSGSGDITIETPDAAYNVTFYSAAGTFTGNIINNGNFALATNAVLQFVIGANGVNNSVSGTGTSAFDGVFSFNLSAAGTTLGDSWTVASAAAQSYSTNFTVSGFLDNNDGTWYRDNGTAKYKFYEDTGLLEVVSANITPISVTGIAPAAGSVTLNAQPLISITLVDGSNDSVIPGSVAMTVNGGGVSPGVASGGGSHVVSYTPASALPAGDVDVVVTYDDDAANSHTNSWSFSVHPTTTDTLWNINIAGSSSGTLRPVSDGVFAVAPSHAPNQWNNVAGINSSLNTFTIQDSTGGNAIGYETSGSHNWGENINNGMTVQMFQGWTGANAPMNMTNVLTGLDSANAYDIYIYSTWRWTQNPVDYEIVEGYADVTAGTITEVQANVQNAASNDYSGCVYGENYIIFENVTPSAAGRIAFTGISSDGVLSGMQIVEIPGGGSIPALQVAGAEPSISFVDTPTLTAYFVDIAETVNAGSISMTVDGAAVTPSYSYSNPTSTVSYTVVTPFEPESVHTAKVVVASTPSGILYTNEWTFSIAGTRVYVDATTTNTLGWNGSVFTTFTPDGVGSNWTTRTPFGNGGEIYQYLTGGGQRLKTTVSGLADSTYDVYAYMWVQGNDWRIQAALTNNPGGDLPQYNNSDYPANPQMTMPWIDYAEGNNLGNWGTPTPNPYLSADLVVSPYASATVMVAEADRRLMEIYIGQVSGTEIAVYIDDDPTGADRTWYDGIGYQDVAGPSFAPVIQSIGLAGGNATLTWTSETSATYSILRKTSLTAGSWTPVKSGIAGGSPTTTDSVAVSGADEEFYKIQGQ